MYKFTYPCPHCGWPNEGDLWDAGRAVACTKCRADHTVPIPKELDGAAVPGAPADAEAATSEAVIRFDCPRCGRHFAANSSVIGKKIRCDGCGKGVYVPDKSGGRAREPRRTSRKASLNSSGMLTVPRRRSSRTRKRKRESFNDVDKLIGGASSASVLIPKVDEGERVGPKDFRISARWWVAAGLIAVAIAVVLTIVLRDGVF